MLFDPRIPRFLNGGVSQLGYTKLGIFQIITCGGCGIWALIDFIQILTGGLKDSDGRDLQDS